MKKEKFAQLCFRDGFNYNVPGYVYKETTRTFELSRSKNNIIVLFDVRNRFLKTNKKHEHSFLNHFLRL